MKLTPAFFAASTVLANNAPSGAPLVRVRIDEGCNDAPVGGQPIARPVWVGPVERLEPQHLLALQRHEAADSEFRRDEVVDDALVIELLAMRRGSADVDDFVQDSGHGAGVLRQGGSDMHGHGLFIPELDWLICPRLGGQHPCAKGRGLGN